jgi:flagellar brake protein
MGNQAEFDPALENDPRFKLSSRHEILAVLRGLQKHHAMVTIYFDDGREFVLTSIAAVDAEHEALIFEPGPDPRSNKLLMAARQLMVVSYQDRVKVQFATGRAHAVVDSQGFGVPLPPALTRLQRRDYYRVDLPDGRAVKAFLRLSPDGPLQLIDVRLVNISCTGIAILTYHPGMSLEIGHVYPACSINLPGVGTISAPLEICNISDVTMKEEDRSYRVGCRFLELTEGMQTMIQRYINKLEGERIQLRR